jgi:NAD(P)-dependent dehydrogenase (short-subunit alcohol dehydrogenase family)
MAVPQPPKSALVALVTGASSGIGLATALALARRSYTVVATMRDAGRVPDVLRAAAVEGIEMETDVLDVTSDDSVVRCTAGLLDRHGRIDVVVNNAGVGCLGTLEELTIGDIQRVIDVNCLGAARVTKAVLPAMRSARQGHLIAVSSIAGVFGQPFNEAYCAGKFALEGLYEALAPVAASVGVSVSLIEAGMVATGFYERSTGRRTPGSGPYGEQRDRFERVAAGAADTGQSPGEVAEIIASVAADPDPSLRYQTGPDVSRLVGRKLSDLDGRAIQRLTRRWVS